MSNFYLFSFILNLILQNIISSDICHYKIKCGDCEYCGKDTKNYESCFYYNFFCLNYINWYTSATLTYSAFYKNEYINYFEQDPVINAYCGQTEYTLKKQESDLIIFDSKNKTFPKNKTIHCHYIIKADVEKYEEFNKPVLEYKITKNEEPDEDRHLKFQLSNIYKYNSKEEDAIQSFSYSEIKGSATGSFYDVIKIEIFLDFLEQNYNQPEEIFQIKVTFNDENKESKSNGSIIGGTIGGTIGGIAVL